MFDIEMTVDNQVRMVRAKNEAVLDLWNRYIVTFPSADFIATEVSAYINGEGGLTDIFAKVAAAHSEAPSPEYYADYASVGVGIWGTLDISSVTSGRKFRLYKRDGAWRANVDFGEGGSIHAAMYLLGDLAPWQLDVEFNISRFIDGNTVDKSYAVDEMTQHSIKGLVEANDGRIEPVFSNDLEDGDVWIARFSDDPN